MKKILLFTITVIGFPALSQTNQQLVEDNKESIEKLKNRINKAEEEINPSILIVKLRDSIALLENIINGLEKKNNTPEKPEITELTLFFDLDKKTLSDSEINKLKKDFFIQKKIKQIIINGYADSIGNQQINNFISQQRAIYVKAFLTNKYPGLAEKIVINWHGTTNSQGERKAVVSIFYE